MKRRLFEIYEVQKEQHKAVLQESLLGGLAVGLIGTHLGGKLGEHIGVEAGEHIEKKIGKKIGDAKKNFKTAGRLFGAIIVGTNSMRVYNWLLSKNGKEPSVDEVKRQLELERMELENQIRENQANNASGNTAMNVQLSQKITELQNEINTLNSTRFSEGLAGRFIAKVASRGLSKLAGRAAKFASSGAAEKVAGKATGVVGKGLGAISKGLGKASEVAKAAPAGLKKFGNSTQKFAGHAINAAISPAEELGNIAAKSKNATVSKVGKHFSTENQLGHIDNALHKITGGKFGNARTSGGKAVGLGKSLATVGSGVAASSGIYQAVGSGID